MLKRILEPRSCRLRGIAFAQDFHNLWPRLKALTLEPGVAFSCRGGAPNPFKKAGGKFTGSQRGGAGPFSGWGVSGEGIKEPLTDSAGAEANMTLNCSRSCYTVLHTACNHPQNISYHSVALLSMYTVIAYHETTSASQ